MPSTGANSTAPIHDTISATATTANMPNVYSPAHCARSRSE